MPAPYVVRRSCRQTVWLMSADAQYAVCYEEEEEVLSEYFQKKNGSTCCSRGQKALDDFGEGIIGKARSQLLYDSINAEYSFVKSGLAVLLGVVPPVERVPKVTFKDEREGRHVSAFVAENKEKIVGTAEEPGLVRAAKPGEEKEECGMFDVPKAGKFNAMQQQLMRIVFDGRRGNDRLCIASILLLLFLLPLLLGGFTLICKEGGFCLNVDMRHMFYQWQWASSYAAYFAVRFTPDGPFYIARVLCLGYHSACAICQCALWGVILYRREGESPLGVRPEEVSPNGVMPRMVWLYEGDRKIGAIFALLDGVFVFTSKGQQKLRDDWEERLRRNCEFFHVEKKTQKPEEERSDGENYVTFSGIEFWPGRGFRPARRGSFGVEKFVNSGTIGEAASLVGQLLWDVRVRMKNVLDYGVLLSLAREIGGKSRRDHDLPLNRAFTRSERSQLNKLSSLRASNDFDFAGTSSPPLKIVLGNTDATRRHRAYVIFKKCGEIESSWSSLGSEQRRRWREGSARGHR